MDDWDDWYARRLPTSLSVEQPLGAGLLEIRPGRLEPCPTELCVVSGCEGTMDLLLSHEEYPDGDSDHLIGWPHLYRRWVCQRDKTHFRNVTECEWEAVKQFGVEATIERQQSDTPLGLAGIVWAVVLLPFIVLGVLFYMVKEGAQPVSASLWREKGRSDAQEIRVVDAHLGGRRAGVRSVPTRSPGVSLGRESPR